MAPTTLRVILDGAGAEVPSGVGRYALELTRRLIQTAPEGCEVSGIMPAPSAAEFERVERELPGLAEVQKSTLDRRRLGFAWQHGLARRLGGGMVHSPSLLAPLYRHDRLQNPGEQTVVTIHDAVPWTHPETLTPRHVAHMRALARRAERFADAVIVPTHAVAEQLADALHLGERVRVISGSVSSALRLGDDHAERAARLGLPGAYLLAVGPFESRKGIRELILALADRAAPAIPLVLAGPVRGVDIDLDAVRVEAGLAPERVVSVGTLHDADLAVAYAYATAVVVPSIAEGFSLPLLEAMSLGTPVIHSDAPALIELAAGAGLVVERSDAARYPHRLALAARRLIEEPSLVEGLSIRGRDRARVFSWSDAAEKTWQLHADL
jgi:glycosyltransferase involved in cell wall biosynthesis